uniref:Uncharacterized protein n=1 Tax=Dicentrarchus labrax TaxID=13489 RepID=A0A8C4E9Y8_DICLA
MMEPDTGEMKPLNGAFVVVAADHLAVGHLLTQAVCWLPGVTSSRFLSWWLVLPGVMVADEDDDIMDAAVVVMHVVVGTCSECQSICRVRFSTNST